jgi:SAM-dependent methyltransferase
MPLPAPHPRTCPVCDGTRQQLLRDHRLAAIEGVSLHAGYRVVACEACGMVYADQIPDQAAFDQYYRECSRYEDPTRRGQPSPVDQCRFEAIAAELAAHLPDPEVAIAEIGSSTGGLLAQLARLGYRRLQGVDPSAQCGVSAERVQGVKVAQGTIFEPLPGAPHQVLLAVGVLEHIRDVNAALDNLGSALVPGGLLYLEVPDLEGFHHTNEAPFQEFSTEHINFFTRGSLENLMARLGFQPAFGGVVQRLHGGGSSMQVLAIAFRKGDRPEAFQPRPNPAGPEAARSYVARCETQAEPERRVIERLRTARAPFAVWGAGTVACRLMATTNLAQAPIAGLVDGNPHLQGHRLAGHEIHSPGWLRGFEGQILVASRGYAADILWTLREELRLANPVLTL